MPTLTFESCSSNQDLVDKLTQVLRSHNYSETDITIDDIVQLMTTQPEEINNHEKAVSVLEQIVVLLKDPVYKDIHSMLLFLSMTHIAQPKPEIYKDVALKMSELLPHALELETNDEEMVLTLTGMTGQGLAMQSVTCTSFLIDQLIKNLEVSVSTNPNSRLSGVTFNAVLSLLQHTPGDKIQRESLEALNNCMQNITFEHQVTESSRQNMFMLLIEARLHDIDPSPSFRF